MRSIKELHYFDALDQNMLNNLARTNIEDQDKIAAQLNGAGQIRAEKLLRQFKDREDWAAVLQSGRRDVAAYLDYLHGSIDGEKLVGDVTPAYSLLSEKRLKMMATVAPDTRFIYLLRDPVRRLWSHVRMIATRRSDSGAAERIQTDEIFDAVLAGNEDGITDRSDYRSVIGKLRNVVDPSRLLITYYEDIFGGDALARICDFLEISRMAPDEDKRIHAGQPLLMLDGQRLRARAWLEEQYDYVRAAIGNMPPAWQYDLTKVQA